MGRYGGDLLSRALRQTTIGDAFFHGRVRNGIGCFKCSITTTSSHSRFRVIQDVKKTSYLQELVKHRLSVNAEHSFMLPLCVIVTRLIAETCRIKPIERLVSVSFTHCCASTSDLSTWWSSTALIGKPSFEMSFLLEMLSAVISSIRSYPAMPLA